MRVQRNTDAALNGEAHVIERERPQHLIQNTPRDTLGHRGISSMQVDHELISTQPTEHVGLAQAGLQSLRHQLKNPVTKGMPQRIVDDLETIKIQKQHGEATRLLLRIRNRGFHAL